MASTLTLKDLYIDELKDLWSANDQMGRALKKISPQATNDKLKTLLDKSPERITRHTELLISLIEAQGGQLSKEHCKGMEGLVAEALKHAVSEAPAKGPVLDAAIIAQYQRMTHCGITGFGTVAAFARALKIAGDSEKLETAVKDMHRADDLMTEIAEAAVNVNAATGNGHG